MPVLFRISLVPYRLKCEPLIGVWYEPLSDGEVETHNKAIRGLDVDIEPADFEKQMGAIKLDLLHRVKKLIGPDGAIYTDDGDIYDTLADSPLMCSEVVRAIENNAYVGRDEAPFSLPPSTGR